MKVLFRDRMVLRQDGFEDASSYEFLLGIPGDPLRGGIDLQIRPAFIRDEDAIGGVFYVASEFVLAGLQSLAPLDLFRNILDGTGRIDRFAVCIERRFATFRNMLDTAVRELQAVNDRIRSLGVQRSLIGSSNGIAIFRMNGRNESLIR
jgi:hypothetical protein